MCRNASSQLAVDEVCGEVRERRVSSVAQAKSYTPVLLGGVIDQLPRGSAVRNVNREFLVRVAAVTGTVVSLVALAVAATKQPRARRVRVRHEVESPSGRFVAKVVVEQESGVRGWRPVIVDDSGTVVFRSEALLPERPTPTIAWEDSLDTLWVIDHDGVVSFVQDGLHGWTSTTLTEDDAHLAPADMRG